MHAERYRRRLALHAAQGQYEAALATLSAWRARSPDLLEPLLLHARIDLAHGHFRSARDRALEAIRSCDCPPELALDAANCLRVLVAHDALVEWANAYPHRAALRPADLARVAAVLEAIGAHAIARSWIEEAASRAPDDVNCLVNRALRHTHAGDFSAARADLERAIATPQDPAIAHWMLSRLDRQNHQVNHVERLHARIKESGGDALDGEFLQFALFKELDDLGDHAAAWTALSEGCRLAGHRVRYDREAHERLFAAIKQQFPMDAPVAPVTRDAPMQIFIVGMHRAGTTLLESMLSANPDVCAYGESYRFSGALRYAADHAGSGVLDEAIVSAARSIDPLLVRDHYVGEGRWHFGNATHVTEKLPGNFQSIGFIRHALPNARILHLRRDPMDLCFANLRERFVDSAAYSYSLADLAHFHALYCDLMQHWHHSYPGFVLDIDYETLVSDPLNASKRVFEFCGLDWNPGVVEPAAWLARPINTLSSVQARGAVTTRSMGRWKPYAKWLEPLRLLLHANA